MARVIGNMPLSGKVGDLVFFERDGKMFVRAKSNKPVKQSEATKKSSKDFGTVTRTAARIRKAFKRVSERADGTLVSRMNKQIAAIFSTIPKKFAGKKHIMQGDVNLLKGFQFNLDKRLQTLLRAVPDFTVLSTGCLHIGYHERPAGKLFKAVELPSSAIIEVVIFCMDLHGNADQIIAAQPLTIDGNDEFVGANLIVPLDLTGDRMVVIAMGIQYFRSGSTSVLTRTWAGGIVFAKKYQDGVECPFVAGRVSKTIVEKKITAVGTSWERGMW